MAGRVGALTPPASAAIIAGGVALGLGPLLWLGFRDGLSSPPSYLLRVLAFTLEQASLSALISVMLALPIARALHRQRFMGRELLLRLLLLPQALPAIVAVLAVAGVYGASGWLPGLVNIYGLPGILLAHVFFNMPLAARLMLARLNAIPPENFRLAAQLGFSSRDMLQHVEWPQLRGALAGIAGLIFLLCAASFTVVLVLGGGPRSTTLEVAIYQALRLDFNPGLAAVLALAQLAICGAAVAVIGGRAGAAHVFARVKRHADRSDGGQPSARVIDGLALLLAVAIIAPPLLSIAASGLVSFSLTRTLLQGLVTSTAIGLAAALLALGLGWALSDGLSHAASRPAKAAYAVAALAGLIVPPAVIATGWFIALVPLGALNALAAPLIAALGGLMALPFVATILRPAIAESHQQHDRLCASVGLSGWRRLSLIEWPVLRRPLALAAVIAFTISLGDLTAVALLGAQDLVTLPALIYRQMGQYRMNDAAGTALILALFCLALSSLAQRWSAPE